jgi:hypothetical protein
MPGGSAGTSFCSGTEMSISFRAMALPPVCFAFCSGYFESHVSAGVKRKTEMRVSCSITSAYPIDFSSF